MQEIIEQIKEQKYFIINKWINKNTVAEINEEQEVIILNASLLVVEAIVHEFMHSKYPSLSENAIIAKTTKKINRSSIAEIQEMVDIIGTLIRR